MATLLSEVEIKELASYKDALKKIKHTKVFPLMELMLAKIVRGAASDESGAEIIREHNRLKDKSNDNPQASWAKPEAWEKYLVSLIKALQAYLKFIGIEYPKPPESIEKYLLG